MEAVGMVMEAEALAMEAGEDMVMEEDMVMDTHLVDMDTNMAGMMEVIAIL